MRLTEEQKEEREGAVDELFDDAQMIFWQAGGSAIELQHPDAIKAVMRLCWETWGAHD